MPPTPTIVVTDRADNTGADVVVSGSDAGSTNTLYHAPITGELGPYSWGEAGSRTGDGAIAANVAKGPAWWHVVSELAGNSSISAIHNQPVTNGLDPVRTRAIDAIVARLKLASFKLSPIQIVVVANLNDISLGMPCIAVFRDPVVPTTEVGGTNLRDDMSYPITVAAMVADRNTLGSPLTDYDDFQEVVSKAFRQQRLPGVPENIGLVVTPSMVTDPAPGLYANLISAVTIQVVCRELRGLS